jgi:hypothetical protein
MSSVNYNVRISVRSARHVLGFGLLRVVSAPSWAPRSAPPARASEREYASRAP